MHEILSDFKQQKASLQRLRRRGIAIRSATFITTLTAFAAVYLTGIPERFLERWQQGDAINETLVLPDAEYQAPTENFQIASADRPRDPVFLFRDAGPKQAAQNKFAIRFQNASSATTGTEKVFFVSDRMIDKSVQLTTSLPALPDDFALMGTSSVEEKLSKIGADESEVIERPVTDASGLGVGWAEFESDPAAGGQANAAPVEAKQQAPEGATIERVGFSTLHTLPQEERRSISREYIFKALTARELEDMIADSGIGEGESKRAALAAARILNVRRMAAGYIVALRTQQLDDSWDSLRVVQLALFDDKGEIGSLGLKADLTYERISNPWPDAGLETYAETLGKANADKRFRIMDGIYSAGVRNDVPPHVISEIIAQMARVYDLGQFIQRDDSLRIIYAEDPRDPSRNDGHVLYASVTRDGETMACYLLRPDQESGYTCMTEKDTITETLGPNGFVIPVNGALRSRFGPRVHPILGSMQLHKGVDWAAPRGTPIKAAFEGTIASVGMVGNYGNLVSITHPGGVETRYAHMSGFAEGIVEGAKVSAGDLIGYVGTTGQSTGPHLHFELYLNGVAIDPLGVTIETRGGGGDDDGSPPIETLINRIIRVESGGQATAKNPLSTASGLGQFIDSTWMRMMRAYRPDIYNSVDAQTILDLRFDPTIAREMLYHFTAENEADLRRSGHPVTAGNLYLAHFLGSGGAIEVLRAAPEEPLENILGWGVISANPFLNGRDAGWVINWAALKMTGRSAVMTVAREIPQLPEAVRIKNSRFRTYSEAIDNLLKVIETNRPSG